MAIIFGLIFLVEKIVWRLLRGDLRQIWQRQTSLLKFIIIISVFLFFVIGKFMDKMILPNAPRLFGLIGYVITLVFIIFIVWILIRRTYARLIIISSLGFILISGILFLVNSVSFRSKKSVETSSIEKLGSLSYVSWAPSGNLDKSGVVLHKNGSTYDGLNFYTSLSKGEAYLIDMNGKVLHIWSRDLKGKDLWENAKCCKNGDVLVGNKDSDFVLLDWESQIKWSVELRTHHNIIIREDIIYANMREDKLEFWHGLPIPMLSDYFAVLSMNGQLRKKIYVYKLVKDQVKAPQIFKIYNSISLSKPRSTVKMFRDIVRQNFWMNRLTPYDVLHTNYIEIMDRTIEGFCKKGDWLISIRELNLIGVLDPDKEQLIWSWGPGELDRQHSPTFLQNGNILIFDNGVSRNFSRVIELNPLTKKIEWEYKSDPPEDFFTTWGGSCQRLPNGNILISESAKGRIFEIDSAGNLVWEFYNPSVDYKNKKREGILSMHRIVNPEMAEYFWRLISKTDS